MLQKVKSPKKETRSHSHADHSAHLKRLNRVKGQLDGIERMILGQRYCPEIIAQIRAAVAALRGIEAEIFRSHFRGCVKSAIASDDAFEAEEKIAEIMKLFFQKESS
jgi:CsoR family transcriptional regulator, copper-sensing transcriptional repressor